MYSLSDYGHMLADRVRMDAYAQALKTAVKPDSIVLDIGTGTGIHAFLACKFGAERVYALEPDSVIHLARKSARENGFADRIEFIHDSSLNISLPQKADIIVSDLRGILPLLGSHVPTIADARRRHLASGGRLIPSKDMMWAALVEARFLYRGLAEPWTFPYGLSMETARQIALNNYSDFDTRSLQSRNLLTEPQQWAVIDYNRIDDPEVTSPSMVQRIERDGTAHGWLVWFDSELTEGIGFSNGPDERQISTVYGRAFFPLLDPVNIKAGDSAELLLRAEMRAGDYDWHWQSRFLSVENQEMAAFSQSTAAADLYELLDMEGEFASLQPKITSRGQIDHFILSKMEDSCTIEQIAKELAEKFPNQVDDYGHAAAYVFELFNRYAV